MGEAIGEALAEARGNRKAPVKLAESGSSPSGCKILCVAVCASFITSLGTSLGTFFALQQVGTETSLTQGTTASIVALTETMQVTSDADGTPKVVIQGRLEMQPSPAASGRRLSVFDSQPLLRVSDQSGVERLSVSGSGALRLRDNAGRERVRIGADDSDEEADPTSSEPMPVCMLDPLSRCCSVAELLPHCSAPVDLVYTN